MDILIVDADQGIRDYYSRLLEAEFRSVRVDFRSSAADALDAILKSHYDLIITESRLPDRPIFEFLDDLVDKKLPVVVVSAESSERLIVECLRSGAMDFLSKSNIKLGQLTTILTRALLEADRYVKLLHYADTLPHRPEFLKVSGKLRNTVKEERAESSRRLINLGYVDKTESDLIEGESYPVTYLYVLLQMPAAIQNNLDPRRYLSLKDRILDKIIQIPPGYGGTLWTRKEDGCFFAFLTDNPLVAVLSALEIRATMNIFHATLENLPALPAVNMGISTGLTVYRRNKSEIYSEALNLAAHISMYNGLTNGIMVTQEQFEKLGPRAMKYFFHTGDFEGRPAYRYEPVA